MQGIAFALAAFAAGVCFVTQQAVNANLRAALGSTAWAGFVSYVGGTLAMLVVALALRDPLPAAGALGRTSWLAWTGGVFGATYIAISILSVPRIGAATFVALLVAGQMIASLLFDHFGLFGIPVHPVGAPRLAGAAFLIAGAVLIRL